MSAGQCSCRLLKASRSISSDSSSIFSIVISLIPASAQQLKPKVEKKTDSRHARCVAQWWPDFMEAARLSRSNCYAFRQRRWSTRCGCSYPEPKCQPVITGACIFVSCPRCQIFLLLNAILFRIEGALAPWSKCFLAKVCLAHHTCLHGGQRHTPSILMHIYCQAGID